VFVVGVSWLCRRVICSRVAGFKLLIYAWLLGFVSFCRGDHWRGLRFPAPSPRLSNMKLKRLNKGARPGFPAIWSIARPTPYVVLDSDGEKLRSVAAMFERAGWGQYLKTVEPIAVDGRMCLRYELPAGDHWRDAFEKAYGQIYRALLPDDPARLRQREQWREQARKRRA
jgi:hypothetical protein